MSYNFLFMTVSTVYLFSLYIYLQGTGKHRDSELYDPVFRNPMYCRADGEFIWELEKLSQHYHPTVVLFSQNMLKASNVHTMFNKRNSVSSWQVMMQKLGMDNMK